MMEITIYELLGMIKDGNAPKEIEYQKYLLSWDNVDKDYYCEEYGNLFEYLFCEFQTIELLKFTVEIIEEEKKIPEKLNNFTISVGRVDDSNIEEYIQTLFNQQYEIFNKINFIIDYLKSKGE